MESHDDPPQLSVLQRDLERVIQGYRAYSDLIIDLRRQGEPLGPTLGDVAARPALENKLLARFGSLGPTLVHPNKEINISWLDIVREGLRLHDFKDQGDGRYNCKIRGVEIELSREHRDKILDGVSAQFLNLRKQSGTEREMRTRYSLTDILAEEINQAKKLLRVLTTGLDALENPSSVRPESHIVAHEDGAASKNTDTSLQAINISNMRSQLDSELSEIRHDLIPRNTSTQNAGSDTFTTGNHDDKNDTHGCSQPSSPRYLEPKSPDEESIATAECEAIEGSENRSRLSSKPDKDPQSQHYSPRKQTRRIRTCQKYSTRERRKGKKFLQSLIATGATPKQLETSYQAEFGVSRSWEAVRLKFQLQREKRKKYNMREIRDGKEFVERQVSGGANHRQLERAYENEFGVFRSCQGLRARFGNTSLLPRLEANGRELSESLREVLQTQEEKDKGKSYVSSLLNSGATGAQIEEAYQQEFGVRRLFNDLEDIFNIKYGPRDATGKRSVVADLPTKRQTYTEESEQGEDLVESTSDSGHVESEDETLGNVESEAETLGNEGGQPLASSKDSRAVRGSVQCISFPGFDSDQTTPSGDKQCLRANRRLAAIKSGELLLTENEKNEGKSFVESLLDDRATDSQIERAYKEEFGVYRPYSNLADFHSIKHAKRRAKDNQSVAAGLQAKAQIYTEKEDKEGNQSLESLLASVHVGSNIETLWEQEFRQS
ncbi:unnamed protein product [Penicillium bialowiezense]